jgi:type IV pilus biogenesis protein CpaD/CtpE
MRRILSAVLLVLLVVIVAGCASTDQAVTVGKVQIVTTPQTFTPAPIALRCDVTVSGKLFGSGIVSNIVGDKVQGVLIIGAQ